MARTVAPNAHKFAKHVVPHVVKPARIVWNQIIGVAFLAFGIPAVLKAIQFYRAIGSDPQSSARFVVSAAFGAIMLAFGIGSFLRARRISRS